LQDIFDDSNLPVGVFHGPYLFYSC